MKKIIMFSIATLISSLFSVTAQSWLWAKQAKTPQAELNDAHGIAMDNEHNAYLTGRYTNDTLILGNFKLIASGGKNEQSFLIKYDENGNLLWAHTSTSSPNGGAETYDVTTDLHNNVYITGFFYDTLYFSPFSVADTYHSKKLNTNVFLVKYDENGNVKWAKQAMDNGIAGAQNVGTAVATDADGNIYITGYFEDTINFGSKFLYNTSSQETFLVKYDSNGNVIWAKQGIHGKNFNSINTGEAITVDNDNNIYITGYFVDTAYFGSEMLISPFEDAFIVKYDVNGNVKWASQSNDKSTTSAVSGWGICTDKKNNIFIDGIFIDTVYFGATELIRTQKEYNPFWAKFDTSGKIVWAKQAHTSNITNPFYLTNIKTDNADNLYLSGLTGSYGIQYANINLAFDTDTLKYKDGGSPFYFIKMDSSGKVLNSYIFQILPGAAIPVPLAVDTSGCYVYLGQTIDTTLIFGTDTVGEKKNPRFVDSPFIARWSDGKCNDDEKGITSVIENKLIANLFPNPNNGNFTIAIMNNAEIISKTQTTIYIYNMLGEQVYYSQFTIQNSQSKIDLSQPSGIYLYRIISKQSEQIATGKFIIQN